MFQMGNFLSAPPNQPILRFFFGISAVTIEAIMEGLNNSSIDLQLKQRTILQPTRAECSAFLSHLNMLPLLYA